jgi:hypothetical protein
MQQNNLERFFTRLLFKYVGDDSHEGREIAYIYNRESLSELNIERQKFDNSQFIEVGNVLTLEGYKCKVVSINFKLLECLNVMSSAYGINLLSPTDPTDFNSQVGIFVERLD